MLNAIEPGSLLPIHRHKVSSETVVCLRGRLVMEFFDEAGKLVESTELVPGGPVVAFNIGGNSDMIEHQSNGYLAKKQDNNDLANGILWCLENNQSNRLGKAGRQKVLNNYTYDTIGKQYKLLYESICNNRS